MHCHCGTNNRAPRWTFADPCKAEVTPGAREESVKETSFLDLNIKVIGNGIHTSVYDKRDDFGFPIVISPG